MTTTRVAGEQLHQIQEALRGPGGLDLLRHMRAIFHRKPSETGDDVARRAQQLGWTVMNGGNAVQLTDIGRRIADSAREYCNWLDDGRGLPEGLEPADVAGKTVLDVGCGMGRYVVALHHCGARPVGVDPCETYLQLAQVLAGIEHMNHVPVLQASGEGLPFADGTFDLLLCIRSLPYMRIKRALSEFARVLKPGGRLLLVLTTLPQFVAKAAAGQRRAPSPRTLLHHLAILGNSCCYQILGHRLLSQRGTASPVYPTTMFLRSIARRAGLETAGIRRSGTRDTLWLATRQPVPST